MRDWMRTNSWIVSEAVSVLLLVFTTSASSKRRICQLVSSFGGCILSAFRNGSFAYESGLVRPGWLD
jgi:hypothetical protein